MLLETSDDTSDSDTGKNYHKGKKSSRAVKTNKISSDSDSKLPVIGKIKGKHQKLSQKPMLV